MLINMPGIKEMSSGSRQLVQLPYKSEDLHSTPRMHVNKPGPESHTCSPFSGEAETLELTCLLA